jgi:hypothetical protein
MIKEELIQLFGDFSVQNGDTYEQRCIQDNDFDKLAEVISSKYHKISIEKDDSGHDYVIPYILKERFHKLLELGEDGEDDFMDEFDKWMCGGDPNSIYEFYIKTKNNEATI